MDTRWQDRYLRPEMMRGGLASGAPSSGMGGDWNRSLGIGSGLGMLGSGLAGLFGGGGSNPYDSASDFYNQIPDTLKPYFDPYIKAGHKSLGQLEGIYGNLLNDPNAIYNKLAGGYQQSPGYQWQLGQGMNAANNAAAAGGMIGTPGHQQRSMEMAQGIASKDFQNYLGQMMGLYGKGISGLEGINQLGYGASSDLASALANYLAMQGQAAFAGQAAENQSQGNMWGNMLGGIGTLASSLGWI